MSVTLVDVMLQPFVWLSDTKFKGPLFDMAGIEPSNRQRTTSNNFVWKTLCYYKGNPWYSVEVWIIEFLCSRVWAAMTTYVRRNDLEFLR